MVIVEHSHQVGRFRFGEDALEDGAAVEVDAHLKSLVPVEQVETGDTGWQRRRRSDSRCRQPHLCPYWPQSYYAVRA